MDTKITKYTNDTFVTIEGNVSANKALTKSVAGLETFCKNITA